MGTTVTQNQKEAITIGGIVSASIAIALCSHEMSPLSYSLFPSIAVMWAVSTERKLRSAGNTIKKLPWHKRMQYFVVLPLLSILGILIGASAYHQRVPALGFWITISIIHGIFIVKLYLLYSGAREKYGTLE